MANSLVDLELTRIEVEEKGWSPRFMDPKMEFLHLCHERY